MQQHYCYPNLFPPAYRWFREQGHPAHVALAYSKAEEWAEENSVTFRWEWDEMGMWEWDCECGCVPDEVLGCVCESEDGEQLASLWGIADPSQDYRRVIEAELALEAMGQ